MRPLRERVFNNLKHPKALYFWWRYQTSRRMPHDCILVTMPGSGTHWIRTMLTKTIVDVYDLPEEIASIRRDDLIPTYRAKQQRFKYNDRLDIPRIQHSHAFFSWLFFREKVILMVRDLRDVVVSHYKTYLKMKDPNIPFSDFLRARGVNRPGQKNNDTLRTLIDFLNSWASPGKKLDAFHLIRFEDLRADTDRQLKGVLEFIGFQGIDSDLLGRVIDFGSIENMQRMEKTNPLPQYKHKMSKIRQGQSGGYRQYFALNDIDYFRSVVSKYLKNDYGYNYYKW